MGIGATSGTELTVQERTAGRSAPVARGRVRAYPQVAGKEADAPLVKDHAARPVVGDLEDAEAVEEPSGTARRISGVPLGEFQLELPGAGRHAVAQPGRRARP